MAEKGWDTEAVGAMNSCHCIESDSRALHFACRSAPLTSSDNGSDGLSDDRGDGRGDGW